VLPCKEAARHSSVHFVLPSTTASRRYCSATDDSHDILDIQLCLSVAVVTSLAQKTYDIANRSLVSCAHKVTTR